MFKKRAAAAADGADDGLRLIDTWAAWFLDAHTMSASNLPADQERARDLADVTRIAVSGHRSHAERLSHEARRTGRSDAMNEKTLDMIRHGRRHSHQGGDQSARGAAGGPGNSGKRPARATWRTPPAPATKILGAQIEDMQTEVRPPLRVTRTGDHEVNYRLVSCRCRYVAVGGWGMVAPLFAAGEPDDAIIAAIHWQARTDLAEVRSSAPWRTDRGVERGDAPGRRGSGCGRLKPLTRWSVGRVYRTTRRGLPATPAIDRRARAVG